MGKNDTINTLVKLLSHALTHKIGALIEKSSTYAEKYYKESINFFNLSRKEAIKENWNEYDKVLIKKELRNILTKELNRKQFIDERKFSLIDKEIEEALKEIGLL